MNQEQYRAYIINGYLDALTCLAMEFRSTATYSSKRSKLVQTYNSVLELLMAFGWSDGLEPDSELPDEVISQEYIQMLRGRKLTYAASKPRDI